MIDGLCGFGFGQSWGYILKQYSSHSMGHLRSGLVYFDNILCR
jgi:hypothetical protein